jgi:hypothetical protein
MGIRGGEAWGSLDITKCRFKGVGVGDAGTCRGDLGGDMRRVGERIM